MYAIAAAASNSKTSCTWYSRNGKHQLNTYVRNAHNKNIDCIGCLCDATGDERRSKDGGKSEKIVQYEFHQFAELLIERL